MLLFAQMQLMLCDISCHDHHHDEAPSCPLSFRQQHHFCQELILELNLGWSANANVLEPCK